MTEKLNSKLTKKTIGKVVQSFNSFLKIPDVMEKYVDLISLKKCQKKKLWCNQMTLYVVLITRSLNLLTQNHDLLALTYQSRTN